MVSVTKHGRRKASVSASELAQMGVCERLVVFEHRYGKRRTVEQQQAIKRGLQAHARFFRDQRMDLARRGGCLFVILMFGRWLIQCVARWLLARERRDEP